LCVSCRVQKTSAIGKEDKCHPWHGYFGTDLFTPVDEDGVEVMPGERTCGHKDCVNLDHVVKENK